MRGLWPAVRFAVGVHPHQAGELRGRARRGVDAVRRGDRAATARCAIGEIGLDYHYDFSPRDVQQAGLPRAGRAGAASSACRSIIHTREATDDTFAILREAGAGRVRGVFHCFTGDEAMARAALDLGFYMSFAGIVTFPQRRRAARGARGSCPPIGCSIETDAPYLAPVPHRGKRNEPAFVARVLETLAALRGVPAGDLGGAGDAQFRHAVPGSQLFRITTA